MDNQNIYKTLGLRKGATDIQIKEAYVQRVKKFDPEKHTDRFMVIQQAYEKLRNPQKRAATDILTFNYAKGQFLFTGPEQSKTSDAQVNQAVQDAERRLAENRENPASQQDFIKALMVRSFKKVSKRLWAEAIEDWQKILSIDPTHQRAKNNMMHSFVTLGYSYADHDLFAEAIELWEKALHMNPDNKDLVHNLAIATEMAGDKDKSKKYWNETLRNWQLHLDANPDDTYMKSCIIEVRRHHGGQAIEEDNGGQTSIEEYQEILKINPNDFEAQYKIATSQMEEHKWADATKSLRKLSKDYPKNLEVLNMLGWAMLNSGQIELAFQAWNRAMAIDPNSHSTREAIIKARMSMGRALRNKGMHTQSIVHFKALLRLLPRSAEVYMEIGQTYMLRGDKRSAVKAFDRVMMIDPKNREARQFKSDMKLRA